MDLDRYVFELQTQLAAASETGDAETIPAVAPDGGDVAMPLREAYEFYGTPRGGVPNYVNGYAVQSLAYTTPFDAQEAAARIGAPFLLVHSEHALAPTSGPQLLRHGDYAQVRTVAGVPRPNRLLRRPAPHRPRRRCNSGTLHDHERLTTARLSRPTVREHRPEKVMCALIRPNPRFCAPVDGTGGSRGETFACWTWRGIGSMRATW